MSSNTLHGTPSPPGTLSSDSNLTYPPQHESMQDIFSIQDLYLEAYPLALEAVRADADGDFQSAAQRYFEVHRIFNRILELLSPGEEYDLVVRKSTQYTQRAKVIWESSGTANTNGVLLKPNKPIAEYERLAQEAQAVYDQAVAEQGKRHEQEALDFYIKSADLYYQSWQNAPEGSVKMMLGQVLSKVMTMAEDLKGVPVHSLLNVKSGSQPVISGPSKLTQQELKVLKDTMVINGNNYYPWSDEDIDDLFRDKVLFEDPDGKLALSAEQEKNFGSWKRASEIMEDPRMVCLVSSASIVQEVVTDCSFVASLCVSASYERRGKKQLIRACIYPKNEFGEPCYNPLGKYLIKLMFNGIHRRVGPTLLMIVVDDYLPVSRTGELMCTCSKNKNELWPSIIEKAYMKVMGGYNFPGSNSSTDLYALTGWVPEHVFIKKCDRDQQWDRILKGQRQGLALVTIATGFMDDEIAEEKGLVPTHAYAVLDIRDVNGLRLLQVKNPWSRKRWKGRFSHLDAENWTEELKKELGYDQSTALKHDDGIFWIDYESVCDEFDTIHINWNPEMLKLNNRMVVHTLWPYSDGPEQDNWNFGNNPQYTLVTNVKSPNQSNIWLLLSKHITETEEKSTDYIALHVFDIEKLRQDPDYTYAVDSTPTTPITTNSATKAGAPSNQRSASAPQEFAGIQGTRIYYEDGSIHKSPYVNSQHILVRLDAPLGRNEYTIVLSQNLKTRDLYFTLRVFATCEFNIRAMPNKYRIKKEIKGEWTEETAGGNKCCAGYMNNPQYRLVVPDLPPPQTTTSVLFALESQSPIPLLVQLMNNNGERVSCVWSKDMIAQARVYRRKFNYCEANNLRSGTYTVVVSTYDPGIVGKFSLTMQSQIKLSLTPIPAEGAGMFKKKIEGQWARGLHRRNELNFARNPYFVVHITEMTSIMARLQMPKVRSQTDEEPPPALSVDIYTRLEDGIVGTKICTSGLAAIPQGVVTTPKSLPGSNHGYLIVLSTYNPALEGEFMLVVYSDREVRIEAMEGVLR